MKFKYFDHTADIIFEAYGKSMEEVFENSALALEEIMVKTSSISLKKKHPIKLEADNIENLLYDFLSELIFLKDADGLLFKKFKVSIKEVKKKFILNANCEGDLINREKHDLLCDAKAITKHLFEIKKIKDKFTARILVDI